MSCDRVQLDKNRRKIVIWGRGGHAKVITDILKSSNTFEVVGYLDDLNLPQLGEEYLDRPVFSGRDHLQTLLADGIRHLVFGFADCRMRLKLTDYVKAKGFKLPVVVHPSAVIASDVRLGEGTVITAGAVVGVGTIVGRSAIINTLASVDHDCTIGAGAHICPGVRLAGNVRVGNAAWIGIGSIVSDGLSLGDECFLGAGSVVVSDIPAGVLAYGVPARVIRPLKAGGDAGPANEKGEKDGK